MDSCSCRACRGFVPGAAEGFTLQVQLLQLHGGLPLKPVTSRAHPHGGAAFQVHHVHPHLHPENTFGQTCAQAPLARLLLLQGCCERHLVTPGVAQCCCSNEMRHHPVMTRICCTQLAVLPSIVNGYTVPGSIVYPTDE